MKKMVPQSPSARARLSTLHRKNTTNYDIINALIPPQTDRTTSIDDTRIARVRPLLTPALLEEELCHPHHSSGWKGIQLRRRRCA
ncbi:MAG: hypothetical protein FJY35_03480 [Betaproteobacteria bacterium]|nr:hypothetical protein [Betaproteobacteria bacterium]